MSQDAQGPRLKQGARLNQVDVLRGGAALWVMLSHYLPHWDRYLGGGPIVVTNKAGIYAVELFFIISGFVIFMTLERCVTAKDFLVMRFSRLYPAYWATLALATLLAVFVFHEHFWAGGFVANATMLQEFFSVPHIDDVYWSLSVEMAFYANAACLMALGWHRRPRVWLPAWLIAAGVWALLTHPTRREYRDFFAMFLAFDYAPFFAIGIVFFDALRNGWSRFSTAVLCLALVVEYIITGVSGVAVASVCTLLFFAARGGHLSFLVNRVTLWLGTISFSFYLLHRRLGYEALNWFHAHHFKEGLAVTLTLAGALTLATAITYCIEQPALHRIRAWYGGLSRRSASPVL